MDAETKRPCARLRDTDRESFAASVSGDPAMVFMFRMASILPMVRASYPLRPAAGLLLDTPRGRTKSARLSMHDLIGKPEHPFSGSCENARKMRAQTVLNDECYAFRAGPCNAPRPSA